jgi:hypothetical protein
MAQIKHLPIYKTTYELLEAVVRATKNFPRDFKYTLGDKIRTEVIDLVVFIFKANATKEKRVENATKIIERIQVIELLIRLTKDMRLINVKQFSEIVFLSDSLGRQASGWIKHTAKLAEC